MTFSKFRHFLREFWSGLPIPMGLKRAAIPFLVSRSLIILIFATVPLVMQIPIGQWGRDDNTTIKLNANAMETGLRRVALGNDAAWYLGIAQNGYEHRPFDTTRQANWAFFPLHPLLWRAASLVTGDWFWSGLLLANVLMLAALSMLWSLARHLTNSLERADDAVMFAAFWPSSYFMMLPHTEALFFALATLSFLAAYSQRWWLAGFASMLAGVTRPNGLFLLPALFANWLNGERKTQNLLKLAQIAAGLVAFMIYLWTITGDPFAFKDIQPAWGRGFTAPWVALLDYIHRPSHIAVPWNPKLVHFVITIIGIASIVTCWKRGWRGLATFTALTLLTPLSTGTLLSMTRFLGTTPGIYLALSIWASEHRRLGQILIAAFALTMALLCVAFAAGINIAGA